MRDKHTAPTESPAKSQNQTHGQLKEGQRQLKAAVLDSARSHDHQNRSHDKQNTSCDTGSMLHDLRSKHMGSGWLCETLTLALWIFASQTNFQTDSLPRDRHVAYSISPLQFGQVAESCCYVCFHVTVYLVISLLFLDWVQCQKRTDPC